ncbi:MAG: glutathione S-transferase family protein [Nodosilinea sp.]
MLALYQFEASAFAEKVRLILDYKHLSYRAIEVTPGIGQLEVFQLSGQRQVPVLKDGDRVIPDSTAIALYLEQTYPDRPLLPGDPKQRGLCLVLEDWADQVIVPNARKAMVGALKHHPNFRAALLPDPTPDLLRTLVESVPGELLNWVGTGVGFGPEEVKTAIHTLQQALEDLSLMLQNSSYLLGEEPTLADFAVAAATLYLKFPSSDYLNLPKGIGGKGVPGLADVPESEAFFTWRDRLYANFRRSRTHSPSDSGQGTGPTPISID